MSEPGNTSRDALIARTVRWAESQKLHPNAIKYAKLYANLTHTGLHLISAYEFASESNDRNAMRAAWDNVIKYMRTLQPRFEASKNAA